ncbi:9305_t:CDS:1, partial [Gigaspora rosea]
HNSIFGANSHKDSISSERTPTKAVYLRSEINEGRHNGISAAW